jgi:phosphoribosyl-AMP cyclohydrolase / phosphoribosyl-ATP pyrophosphohydrolase
MIEQYPDRSLIESIRWDERGLVPAIVQDDLSGQVLMMAWMNRESLDKTLETRETHFWSRSRKEIWHKGGTSGNVQTVRAVHVDCDGDTLLVLVDPAGPACHTGERSCFYRRVDAAGDPQAMPFGARLYGRLQERKDHPRPESYTSQLLSAGQPQVLRKVGEEAVEVIVAAQSETEERLISEVADLVYHLTVLLVQRQMSGETIDRELRARYSGH